MKILKRSVTVALLLFVGATVGLLIAQEVSPTDSAPSPATSNVATAVSAPGDESAEALDASATGDASASGGAEDEVPPAPNAEDGSTETLGSEEVQTTDEADSAPETTCVVDAIYFHNTLRCYTCKHIEETAKAIMEEEFAEQLASGLIRWSAINMERQQHYVEEFDLVMPTLILVRTVGGEQSDWVALDETWSLIRSESRFANYIKSETRAFLEECP